MFGDLKDPRAMYAKGLLFVLLGLIASAMILADSFHWKTLVLLMICIWAFCRSYYFAFYVVEHYIDPSYRFAGLIDFARYCMRKRHCEKSAPPTRLNS